MSFLKTYTYFFSYSSLIVASYSTYQSQLINIKAKPLNLGQGLISVVQSFNQRRFNLFLFCYYIKIQIITGDGDCNI